MLQILKENSPFFGNTDLWYLNISLTTPWSCFSRKSSCFIFKFWCSRFQFPFECWLDVISGCISSQQVFTLQRKCCILHDIVPLFLLFHSSYNALTPQTSHQLFGITLTFLRVGLCSRSVALCFGSVGLRSSFLGFCFWNTLIFAGRKKIKNIFGWGTSFYSKIYLLIIIREENYSEY